MDFWLSEFKKTTFFCAVIRWEKSLLAWKIHHWSAGWLSTVLVEEIESHLTGCGWTVTCIGEIKVQSRSGGWMTIAKLTVLLGKIHPKTPALTVPVWEIDSQTTLTSIGKIHSVAKLNSFVCWWKINRHFACCRILFWWPATVCAAEITFTRKITHYCTESIGNLFYQFYGKMFLIYLRSPFPLFSLVGF